MMILATSLLMMMSANSIAPKTSCLKKLVMLVMFRPLESICSVMTASTSPVIRPCRRWG